LAGRIRLVNGRLSAPQDFDAADMDAAIAAAMLAKITQR
jgi:hypothetical protein